MAGKLKESMTITDHRQQLVCILPTGFYFDDERWEAIWERYEAKGETLIHEICVSCFPTKRHCNSRVSGRTAVEHRK
mgnify:FL=1